MLKENIQGQSEAGVHFAKEKCPKFVMTHSFSGFAVMKCMGFHKPQPMLSTYTPLVTGNPLKHIWL